MSRAALLEATRQFLDADLSVRTIDLRARPMADRTALASPPATDRVLSAIARLASDHLARPLPPGLHLVATPIGNLGDVSLRTIATLANADMVCCEDRRHSMKLLAACGLDRPLRTYEEHSAPRVRPAILDALSGGARVALISDAGSPLVSDPGFKLVSEAANLGIPIHVVPGPSAALAALAVSGLPTDRFTFVGFLPAKAAARQQALSALAARPETLVMFEAPNRVAGLLNDAATVLGDRPAALCRELTKQFEETVRQPLSSLAAWSTTAKVRGEVTLVIAGATSNLASVEALDIDGALAALPAEGGTREKASALARALGINRRDAYRLILDRADAPPSTDATDTDARPAGDRPASGSEAQGSAE